MMAIRPIKFPLYSKTPTNRAIAAKGNLYQQSNDVFVRSDVVKSVATDFREKLILPFSNWEEAFPADGEDGSQLLKSIILPYQDAVGKFSKPDAEVFTRLVFGDKYIEQIEKASVKNSDLRNFKKTLENVLGKSLSSFHSKT